MTVQERISAFTKLGVFLHRLHDDKLENTNACLTDCWENLHNQINQSVHHNGWFTRENVLFSIQSWANALTEENLIQWTAAYDFTSVSKKTVGIVTAGNIPLVGMHDFISVLISGHQLVIKQSSSDQKLLPIIAQLLICFEPRFKSHITFTDQKLEHYDAVIATGSNNSARYFEYYFGKVPHIIRKNRNAVAVLTGHESETQMEALGTDIFQYFGLGCRSVSKLFVPKNYDFDQLFKAVFKHQIILDHNKYKNNYDYNKTIYLMSQIPLLENGFLVLKEDTGYASPISVLFYEYYDSLALLKLKLNSDRDLIQCLVSDNLTPESVTFGQTQHPQLWDYADGVDTLQFLLSL